MPGDKPIKNTSLFSCPGLEQIVQPLLNWFAENARDLPWRKTADPYSIWISEIMLQQTRVDTVIPYFERFIRAIPDIRTLAEIPEEQLLKYWEGLGYYSRARNLQKAARMILQDFHGIFPSTAADIAKLPGIGAYSAGSIASIAFGLPEPAVDGNVLRVLTRLAECKTNIAVPRLKFQVADALRQIYPAGQSSEFTQALMELGAMVCIPNGQPQCLICPLNFYCRACLHGSTGEYPVKELAKTRKLEKMTVFHLIYRNEKGQEQIALCKRPPKGLLAGLWQFPWQSGYLNEQEIRQYLDQLKITAGSIIQQKSEKHIFTHIEWQMQVWQIDCITPPVPEFTWVDARQLAGEYALPVAFRKTWAGSRHILPSPPQTVS